MSDVIYREDALERLRSIPADLGRRELDDSIKAIESMPSAQQWIPCSERLPEEGVPVLGSFEVEGDRFILPTSIFVFDEEEGKSWTGTMGLKPIAWMLLPEPYREEVLD